MFLQDFNYFLTAEFSDFEKEFKQEDYIDDRILQLINVGLLFISNSPISVRDQDDYKMSNPYIIEGGDKVISFTKTGDDIKFFLNN